MTLLSHCFYKTLARSVFRALVRKLFANLRKIFSLDVRVGPE